MLLTMAPPLIAYACTSPSRRVLPQISGALDVSHSLGPWPCILYSLLPGRTSKRASLLTNVAVSMQAARTLPPRAGA